MDMPRNAFKHAIAKGELQIGLWCSLCSNIAAEIVSHSGFDWLLLDTEHSPNEVPDILAQLQAAQAGTASLHRAAGLERHGADQALSRHRRADAADSVRAERRKRRKRAVEATRYPPKGMRGITGCGRASRYGRVKDYLKNASSEICLLVQVETREALDADRGHRVGRRHRRRVHRPERPLGLVRPYRQLGPSGGAGRARRRGEAAEEDRQGRRAS